MRTIEDIIIEWKAEFGVLARNANGPYRYIDYRQKKDNLMTLVATLIAEGYDEDVIKSTSTVNAIVNGCEAPDGASSREKSKIKKGKQITATQLKTNVFPEFFRGKFVDKVPDTDAGLAKDITVFEQPKEIEIKKPVEPTKEELLDKILNPKDRLVSAKKIDRRNNVNWELLEALGLDLDEADNE